MEELAKFNDSEPVFSDVPVVSKASGHEAMSQVFGEVGKAGFNIVSDIQKEQSSAMLMNANAQLNSLKTDTAIQIMQNPAKASEIAAGAETSLNTISQVKLNSGDRAKLNYLIQGNKDDLALQAAKANVNVNRLQNQTNFWGAYNQSMSQYSEAIATGDYKKADIIHESMLNTAKAAVLDESITPQGFENIIKSLSGAQQRATDLHTLITNPNATAVDIHRAALDIHSSDNVSVSQLPANYGTHALANHYSGVMTKDDINNDIYHLNFTPQTLANISNQSPEEFAQTANMIRGSQDAHGLLNSNPAYPDIESRMQLLNNKAILSSREQSELQVYKNYMKELESGSFWEVQGSNTLGAQAINDWNQEKAAIQNHVSYALSTTGEEQNRQQMLANADNKLIDRGVAIGEGSHMDPRLIRPVPEIITSQVQSSFNIDGDPKVARNQISRLRMRNRGYLGAQMKEGTQKEVITAIGFGQDNNMSDKFANDYITSNKTGINYDALKVDGAPEDKVIMTQIANNSPDIIKMFSLAGGEQSANRINDFTKSALNYVKFRALQAGDLTISNLNTYIDDFSKEISHAYNISSRSSGMINTNQIPMSSSQQDLLQNYVKKQAINNYKSIHGSDSNFSAGLSKIDINVYVDSTNHVIAKDSSGNTMYYAPYSDKLMAASVQHNISLDKKSKEQAENILKHRSDTGWIFGD